MAVILEQYTIPEVGAFEICQPVFVKISAQEAQRKVSRWLCHEVTMMLSGEEPTLVVGEWTRWQVPVIFSAPPTGRVGAVGAVEVDAQSGVIDKNPENIKAILCATRKLSKILPPFQVQEVPPQYLATHLPAAPRLFIQEDGQLTLNPSQKVN